MTETDIQATVSEAVASFGLPDEASFLELARDLRLSTPQAVALEETLRDVDADLRIYRAMTQKRPHRPDMLANLKKMEKLAEALRGEISRHKTELLDFMPHEGLRRMASLLTFSEISKARGKSAFPKDFAADMQHLENRLGRMPDLADIETHYDEMRADFGLTDPADLLLLFLDTLTGPMATLIEINHHNPGGRPISAERRYLIQQLAHAAPQILGEAPTASLTGRFVDLCEQVAVRCGLSAEGIDKLAVAVVQELAKKLGEASP